MLARVVVLGLVAAPTERLIEVLYNEPPSEAAQFLLWPGVAIVLALRAPRRAA